MGLFRRAKRPAYGVHVDDPRYDDWETVGEFEDVPTARAFGDHLGTMGIEHVLVADHAPGPGGRGDIYLRVPGELYGDATVALDGLDL